LNVTDEWFETDPFGATLSVRTAPIARSGTFVSQLLKATLSLFPTKGFPRSGRLQDSMNAAKTVIGPTAPHDATSLHDSQTHIPSDAVSQSQVPFEATECFGPTQTILASELLTQSKTFLRSPDLMASDTFISTALLTVDNAAAGSAGSMEMPTFVGIGAAVLAALVVICLAVW
jgi:hypothetical protein